jgi:hypothetical protein
LKSALFWRMIFFVRLFTTPERSGFRRERTQTLKGARPRLAAIIGFVVFTGSLCAQNLMSGPGGQPAMVGPDMAVLEAREIRKDLPCDVQPAKPALGFDLKFHAGFDIVIPLKELAGPENQLTILFRVIPDGQKDAPVYLVQKIRVPPIPEDAKGDVYLQGAYDVGEGHYHVDWLMRDRTERVCSNNWEMDAELPPKDKQLQLHITPSSVVALEPEQFADEPPVLRGGKEPPLSVKVLINFAPQNAQSSVLQPLDTAALVSILRCISRDSRIGKFSVVAYNLQEQKVLYRQDSADKIDFPGLGKALDSLQLGRVNLTRLANKNSGTEFLSQLIRNELNSNGHPDAVIFAGPKAMLEQPVSPETLRTVGEPDYPVFYMNYNLYPQQTPWRDSIGQAVKYFRGTEYTISRPRDLWYAVSEMVNKIVKSRSVKRAAVGSPSN